MWTFNQSGLLFTPARWQRTAVIHWLKRTHAWTGFWGAIIFLLLGISGILLNHRSIWKIDTGQAVAVRAMNIPVAPGDILTEKDLGQWAKRTLELSSEPRAPRKEPERQKSVFLGKALPEAPKWSQQFTHPNGRVTVEYIPGSASVGVKQDEDNAAGFIQNLHKGSGVGLIWVLFLDTIAGALITMTLTGCLLWSRLHGGRLLAVGIMFTSLAVALAGLWPFLL
jgi:uncharacterized protein